MKILGINRKIMERLICGMCLLLSIPCEAEKFVELTAEIQIDQWDYEFLSDKMQPFSDGEKHRSIFRPDKTIHCVVGSNTWTIAGAYGNHINRHWFTGMNVVNYSMATNTPDMNEPPHEDEMGKEDTWTEASMDGNPGRPVHVSDLMGFDLTAKAGWMAFCSGSALKCEGRTIYPTSDQWKESSIYFTGWMDRTAVFPDELGLPKSILLINTNRQIVFQYQVRGSTNVLGWNFPVEFYGVQYIGSSSNGWRADLTIKGRLKSIGSWSGSTIADEMQRPAKRPADQKYILETSGGIIGITNAPNSTPVHISFTKWDDVDGLGHVAAFRLNNDEDRSILVWNYRVQVKLPGDGTNSPEWKTVRDDYPSGGEVCRLSAMSSDKILMAPPGEAPWRFCIIYSKGIIAGEKPGEYSGDYEVISKEMLSEK